MNDPTYVFQDFHERFFCDMFGDLFQINEKAWHRFDPDRVRFHLIVFHFDIVQIAFKHLFDFIAIEPIFLRDIQKDIAIMKYKILAEIRFEKSVSYLLATSALLAILYTLCAS